MRPWESVPAPAGAGAEVVAGQERRAERRAHSRSRIATIGCTKFGPWSHGNKGPVAVFPKTVT